MNTHHKVQKKNEVQGNEEVKMSPDIIIVHAWELVS